MTLPAESSPEISPRELHELLASIEAGEIDLIDCREEDEWRFNRLPHARLQPLSSFGEFPLPERPAVVYCHHGMRSLRAASYLRQKGLHQAWSMAGGIERWSLEIDPSVLRY